MNKLIVFLFVVFTLAMVFILGVSIWGFMLPADIRFSHNRTIKTTPAALHSLLLDTKNYSKWKPGLEKVTEGRSKILIEAFQELADKDEILKKEGRYVPRPMPEKAIKEWTEHYQGGEQRSVGLVFQKENSVYHHHIQDTTLPYNRRWYFLIKPFGDGRVVLEIQEEKVNKNAFFRVWNRVFNDPIDEIRSWMDGIVLALQSK